MAASAAIIRLISLKRLSTGILLKSRLIVNTFPLMLSVLETALFTSKYSRSSCKLVTHMELAEVASMWSTNDLNAVKELTPCVPRRHNLCTVGEEAFLRLVINDFKASTFA